MGPIFPCNFRFLWWTRKHFITEQLPRNEFPVASVRWGAVFDPWHLDLPPPAVCGFLVLEKRVPLPPPKKKKKTKIRSLIWQDVNKKHKGRFCHGFWLICWSWKLLDRIGISGLGFPWRIGCLCSSKWIMFFMLGEMMNPKPLKPPPSFVAHLSNSVNFILWKEGLDHVEMILCQAQFFFYQEDGGRVPNLIHWDALIDPHGPLFFMAFSSG